MNFLEERIVKDGVVKKGNVLKVDSFLNHQMDIELFDKMGEEFKRRFANENINKIVTIEASGIALAIMAGYVFGCKAVFAKKSKSKNISDDVYSVEVESFTHGNTNTVIISREYLHPGERVLIVDDFLATGAALIGLRGRRRGHRGRKGVPGRRRQAAPRGNESGISRPHRIHVRQRADILLSGRAALGMRANASCKFDKYGRAFL